MSNDQLRTELNAMTMERDDLLKASKYWSSQLEASMRDLSECQKELDRYLVALRSIQFLGTKGTATIWPDRVLKECVGVATNAMKRPEC